MLPYTLTYTGITAWGLPFLLFTQTNTSLVRADGSPTWAMLSSVTGAAINVGLDALFMLVFGWGIAGAAIATVTSQIISFLLTASYFFRFKTFSLDRKSFGVSSKHLKSIVALGAAPFLNMFIIMLVQVVLNNTLTHYGALTEYGSSIPLAVAGVINKLQMILVTVCVGLSQGAQPIFGFNYGAKQFQRVRETYRKAAKVIVGLSILFFLAFQLFPNQLVSIFGSGESPLYFEFARQYMRVYLFMLFISGIQPLTSNYFTAIGKAKQGIFLSLTRQGLFLLPLLLILPVFFGLNGAVYAGPIADTLAVVLAISMIAPEMKWLGKAGQGHGKAVPT